MAEKNNEQTSRISRCTYPYKNVGSSDKTLLRAGCISYNVLGLFRNAVNNLTLHFSSSESVSVKRLASTSNSRQHSSDSIEIHASVDRVDEPGVVLKRSSENELWIPSADRSDGLPLVSDRLSEQLAV